MNSFTHCIDVANTPRKAKSAPAPRMGEELGAGFFVMRRAANTGRIHPSTWPFEHPTFVSAVKEAERLSGLYPSEKFEVFMRMYAAHRGHEHCEVIRNSMLGENEE